MKEGEKKQSEQCQFCFVVFLLQKLSPKIKFSNKIEFARIGQQIE
jgi:hypothetical protein